MLTTRPQSDYDSMRDTSTKYPKAIQLYCDPVRVRPLVKSGRISRSSMYYRSTLRIESDSVFQSQDPSNAPSFSLAIKL